MCNVLVVRTPPDSALKRVASAPDVAGPAMRVSAPEPSAARIRVGGRDAQVAELARELAVERERRHEPALLLCLELCCSSLVLLDEALALARHALELGVQLERVRQQRRVVLERHDEQLEQAAPDVRPEARLELVEQLVRELRVLGRVARERARAAASARCVLVGVGVGE